MGEDTIEEKFDINTMKSHLMDYINNRIKLIQLTTIEYVSKILPVFVYVAIMALLMLVFWIFLNVASAIAIGKALDNLALGFVIISLLNLAIAGFITLTYKSLIFKPVSNWIAKLLTESLEADENK